MRLTKRCKADAAKSVSRSQRLNAATVDGLSGGCRNASCGLSFSQNSSSTSRGYSTVKLPGVPLTQTHGPVDERCLLLFLYSTGSSKDGGLHAIQAIEIPPYPFPKFILHGWTRLDIRLPTMRANVLHFSYPDSNGIPRAAMPSSFTLELGHEL
jgi:hypothetical protein